MKTNKIKLYAFALAEVLSKKGIDEKKVVDNFVKLLIADGLSGKSKEILSRAQELMLAKRGGRKIIFETARKTTAGQRKILAGVAKAGDIVEERINPELIAGVRIIIDNAAQFDGSLKNKLQGIFNN